MLIESPQRSRHRFTMTLDATPQRVFPLFSPALEQEWGPSWDPNLVISSSGMAEEACIFITPSTPHDAIWVVTRLDPDHHFVELLKVVPDHTMGTFQIQLETDNGVATQAAISCTYTAMGPEGKRFVEQLTPEHWNRLMKEWERSLNHFLTTGKKQAQKQT
ncbi:hypothetical protein [Desulfoluna sp.]|uniref:hypothetical protein n=1 Tax=Desulfoluna sp. TaxID=2045199 RepID=UPI00260A3C8B|nr:hypothetical protein [Desulfoluna sp.]